MEMPRSEVMVPVSADSSPGMIENRVVLPAPFGPTSLLLQLHELALHQNQSGSRQMIEIGTPISGAFEVSLLIVLPA